jgi:hypothetical protein
MFLVVLLMIKEAFKDAWEDYYVFNVKDERDLAHKGLVFLMTRNYRGYIPKHFGIFFHNFFKFLKEFRKFLMADLSLGVSALVLLIDIVTKPIFVFYRSKSSFYFFLQKGVCFTLHKGEKVPNLYIFTLSNLRY